MPKYMETLDGEMKIIGENEERTEGLVSTGFDWHYHKKSTQEFKVLEGSARMRLASQLKYDRFHATYKPPWWDVVQIKIVPGCSVTIPPLKVHSLYLGVANDKPLEIYLTTKPKYDHADEFIPRRVA